MANAEAADPVATTWKLVAPDWSGLDTIWHYPLPFVLWPVGNQPLLAHWMDEAVRRGTDNIELYVSDRPAEVRAFLGDGDYWSRQIKIIPVAREEDAPADAERIDRLPGSEVSLPRTPAELLEHWFDLQKTWLARRSADARVLDTLHESGGWIGVHARVHPSARLTPPFWIGPGAEIDAQCEIGPNAFIGEQSVLDRGAQVEDGCVLPRTYLGRNTRISHALAENSVLVDFGRGCRVEIEENFILAPVADETLRPNLFDRSLALAAFLLLMPLAKICTRNQWTRRSIRTRERQVMILRTGRQGPLWARRWPWLSQIARGQLHWTGILPRVEADWERMPPETARRLRSAPVGLFSLSDIHDAHDPSHPEEWIHAAAQALGAQPRCRRAVLRNLWKIAWARPADQ